uniref:Zonadhesin-like n=1 Tax=Poecilia formosa TaxID=48698 RepID=A0A096M1D9_POEFO
MLGKIHTDLLITVALIFLAHLESMCRAENDLSLVKLPGWKDTSGVCTIQSNTDCHTFDGALFRFTSPCTYILAKTCSASEALPKFTVAVANMQTGNVSQPTIQRITVNLGNTRVSLLKSQTHWVVVNGIWRELPLNLNNNTIHIESNPAAVVVRSSSGVSVSFDNAGALQLRIPLQYSDRVCGLCGNFNQLPGDDLLKPDGTKAESATALAESWQTGGNVSSCEAIQVPQQCNARDEAHYSSENYCGLLRSGSGPFASCLPDLGAESYFRACLLSLCSARGDQKVLCEALKAYADVCREAGIAIPTWRNSTFCSLECGENSHYNSCANGCPEVCSSLDQSSLCGSCEERCECDHGFSLSGGKCVPAEHCGCWHNGKHYERGGMTVEGDCVRQCQCIGNNTMRCTAMTCASDEVCKEKNGIKGCFPFKPATCSVYGDPHYVTFDELAYSFQGGCAYTLATTCGRHSTVQFTVTGFNIHPAGQNFTRAKLEAVVLQLDGLDVTLNQSGQVDVHGVSVRLPYSTNGSYGSLWIFVKEDYTVLETTFGLKLWIDGHGRLFLQVDERYEYELCGLCGTYSGYQEDDFMMPGGHIASGSFEFGDSWRTHTTEDEKCIAHPNDPRECDNDGTVANEECSMVFHGAFEACHEYVHPSIYFSSCVYDYCATSGDQLTFCESMKSYATACQVEGVELSSWQTGTPCDFSTPDPTIPGTTSLNINSCPLNCSFDTNMCGWEQLIQDSFDWTRHSGSTPSDLTGPNQDHTTGAGFYMYLEGDDVTYGDPARLLSPSCQLDGPICFHFWYHMLGSATSMVLNVYQLQGNKATRVWTTVDNKGPEWQLGLADLRISGPFKLIIEGIRGSTAQSDLAIDDIAITSGSCSGDCCLLKMHTPIILGDVHELGFCNFDCSFQNGLCTWRQMITDAFDWERNNGSTPTEMTGPSSDHTGGNDGHYIYIESTNTTHGDAARLISSQCANIGPQCLQFWYHMYGSADAMGLNIYLLENKVAKAVWQKRNNHGDMWHLAQVDLNTTAVFQIIIEGRRGSNDQSDVAIDDIALHQGRCSDLVNPATVAPANWTTTNAPEVPAPSTTTAQGNATPGPQVPAPTNQAPSDTRPQPSPTGGPHATTAQGNATPGPQVPAPTNQAPSDTRPQPSPTAPTNPAPSPETGLQPPPSCAENSHYTTCIPACSPTCKNLTGPPHCSSEISCDSGCVCDDGFVQKGSICVPVQKCGCIDRNGETHQFNEIWYTSHCKQKCECEEDDGEGKVDCKDKDGCEDDAVCLQLETGKYYCKSTDFGECTVQGNPQYQTFDKLKHGFSGTNLYVLVRTKNLPKNLPEIYIEGTNACTDDSSEEMARSEISGDDDEEEEEHKRRLQELKIKVYNHTVELKHKRKVFVDGKRIKAPGSAAPGLDIQMHSSRVYLKTDFGLLVEFSGHCKADIILPFLYKRRVEGLCGNFDGRKTNDKVKPDGTIAKNTQ